MGLNLFDTGLSIFADVTIPYHTFGSATTVHSIGVSGDVLIGGVLEVQGRAYFDGQLDIKGNILSTGTYFRMSDNREIKLGSGNDTSLLYQASDADAKILMGWVDESADSGNNVPAFVFGEKTPLVGVDLGLFDEVVQPHIVTIENSGKYAAVSNATSTGADVAVLTTATAGTFTNAVVGDTVRVTAGTNATVGWYFIDVATDQYNVTLDRNWCTGGAVSGGTIVCFHKLSMMTPKAIYLPIYDTAPADSDIDINMDGAMALEVTQANGRLYWRANNGWHYVDATAGLSMPASERVDPKGKEFKIGSEVKLIVDRINEDGSFHAMPYRR